MSTLSQAPSPELVHQIDQRVTLDGLRWSDYQRLLSVRGESDCPRLTYLEGRLELMSPSHHHEWIKTTLARLLEAYADERGIELDGFGSWTICSEPDERGLEPDECYILGPRGAKTRPDLAIEVDWTSGSIDKLEVYRGLGVAEVWIWRQGKIVVHLLRGGRFEIAQQSALLPELDLVALSGFLERSTQSEASRAFRDWLRARR